MVRMWRVIWKWCRQLGLGLGLLCGLSVYCSNMAWAFEAFYVPPGARAAGLNGIFSMQANDGTAIWYNPAGLMQPQMSRGEVSIDTGLVPVFDNNRRFDSEPRPLKFVGGFLRNIPLLPTMLRPLQDKIGVGIALLSPYRVSVDIEEASNVLNPLKVGSVRSTFNQISPTLSWQVYDRASVGGTLDYIWTDIECVDAADCDKQGPSGYGYSLGSMWVQPMPYNHTLTVAGIRRAGGELGYRRVAQHSLSDLFLKYLPDRPSVNSIGIGYSGFYRYAQFNLNVLYERIHWQVSPVFEPKNSEVDTNLRYQRLGSSGEMLVPAIPGYTLMLRGGVSRTKTSDPSSIPQIWAASAGLGLAIGLKHFIDLALEKRRISALSSAQSIWLWSFSYARQY